MKKLLISISILASVFLGAQAQAYTYHNGFTLNGFTLNGFTLNGFTLNGFTLNGFTLNGFTLNGFTLNGAEAHLSHTNGLAQLGQIAIAK